MPFLLLLSVPLIFASQYEVAESGQKSTKIADAEERSSVAGESDLNVSGALRNVVAEFSEDKNETSDFDADEELTTCDEYEADDEKSEPDSDSLVSSDGIEELFLIDLLRSALMKALKKPRRSFKGNGDLPYADSPSSHESE
jgi:hypothetical protein